MPVYAAPTAVLSGEEFDFRYFLFVFYFVCILWRGLFELAELFGCVTRLHPSAPRLLGCVRISHPF